MSKVRQPSKTLITVEENAIFALLPYVGNDAEDFDDPENGDYLDRLESIFRTADQLDSFVVKIAIDRTHFFMGNWSESYFSSSSYEVIPDTSPATDRLNAALAATSIIESTGLKKALLSSIDSLQIEYFWRECQYPNPSMISELSELISKNRITEPVVVEFVLDNILEPWEEFLDVGDEELQDGYDVQPWIEEYDKFRASDRC